MKIKLVGLLFLLMLNVWVLAEESIFHGTSESDELHGSTQADTIYGGEGDDEIDGGEGADILYGGLGADRFIIQANELDTLDTVKDFNPDEGDTIVLKFRTRTIKNIRIPKEIGTDSVKVDRNGNLKILMDNHEWLSIVNLEKSDMYFVVENESNAIRFIFKKSF